MYRYEEVKFKRKPQKGKRKWGLNIKTGLSYITINYNT